MNVTVSPKISKRINARVKSGQYQTPGDVIAAAISSLDQQENFGNFAPGELDALLAEAERDIERGDVLDADEVFAELRRMSAARRAKAG